jgi:hypothetical protein
MSFCLRPDEEPEAAVQPPIWSMVVYMLLTETFKVDDGALGQIFGLPVPSDHPSESLLELRSRNDAQGRWRSTRFVPTIEEAEKKSRSSHSDKLTEVRIGIPLHILLMNRSRLQVA